ncbi:hypothetical protein RUESEDTHA_03707 [Ruegeria sp. THAF57]|uniref:4a-hydroxytetrahydrobiopterin dehydratase n=1 Tax=Ruegeria sp. THAF57 TaxID=2744555 RepID=UPI001752C5E7|nr:4a-hydroxytetrahydrobiopterin dehydratase [Ruegeria sp. THAF57]CAD0186796.1 hypothetical protein RUESEDTHA_03707 [Ruegeria sp. THAF57]
MDIVQSDTTVPPEMIPPDSWTTIASAGALHRRFEFENYAGVSAFLERLADLSKEVRLYPDLSFSKTHVNVTIPAGGDEETLSQSDFAERSNQLFDKGAP